MEFKELARIRQSDRKYSDKPVEREKIIQCLETARIAPSANNSQPWKFIVVDEPVLKEKIANCAQWMGMNKFAQSANVFIAVVIEEQSTLSKFSSVLQNKPYYLMDIGIAVNQFCLQAADLELGTCMIGWFDEKSLKKHLNIDRKKRVPLLISIGYPAAPTREKKRKPLEEVSSWNGY